MTEIERLDVPNSKNSEETILEAQKHFLGYIGELGLPSENIFVGVDERVVVFHNVKGVLNKIPESKRSKSMYISKFLAAIYSGLFDAALNYLWDETIQEIRERVINYDLEFFYQNISADKAKKNQYVRGHCKN